MQSVIPYYFSKRHGEQSLKFIKAFSTEKISDIEYALSMLQFYQVELKRFTLKQ